MQASASFAIQLEGLTKIFGELRANDGVSLNVKAGTIHGVIGENGAGKSTAMKMLYGQYQPDGGAIRIFGEQKSFSTPQDAIACGIGMVHQHFMLAGPYTALENILLGAEPTRGGPFVPHLLRWVSHRAPRAKLEALSKQFGFKIDLDAPIETLPVGTQQQVEILKLLYRDAKILILDEPTAVLTPQETEELFMNLRKLKALGKTILIITHKLKEVMALTDHVTVFRAGRVTGEVETKNSSPQELADLMVGRKVLLSVDVPPQPESREPVLTVRALNHGKKLQDLSLTVHSGEVLGIAGVEGNGQSELLKAILHPSDPAALTSGAVFLHGNDVTQSLTREIRDEGVGLIPEDRHDEGLLLEQSVSENYVLGLQRSPRFSKNGLISQASVVSEVKQALEEFDVRPRNSSIAVGRLSGGNQQKLIIAREMSRKPKLLIAAQPTRGVDVGAIEFIHKRILKARTEGAAVLLVSSELDEVLALSDRILVLFEGKVAGEFKRGEADEKEIGLLMGCGRRA